MNKKVSSKPSYSSSNPSGSNSQPELSDSPEDEDFDPNKGTLKHQHSHKFVETSSDKKFCRFNEEIGRGAQKTVYRGWDEEKGREVAWNVIKLPLTPSKETTHKISNEIRLLKNLAHPNIINLLGAWLSEAKGEVVFITEICQGGSLKNHLKKFKNLRKGVIKKWCINILESLEYLHTRDPPIIHRDIKCDNMFINSTQGEIILGDFGLASANFGENNNKGSIVGTPEYMAPEIFDEDYNQGVDIYAFGMCVLEMCSGTTPYSECKGNPLQIYKKISDYEKPKVMDRILDGDLKSFIEKCIGKKELRPGAAGLLGDSFLVECRETDNTNIMLGPDLDKEVLQKNRDKDRRKGDREREDSFKLGELPKIACHKGKSDKNVGKYGKGEGSSERCGKTEEMVMFDIFSDLMSDQQSTGNHKQATKEQSPRRDT
jgi:WNK lysine deficient protein kinase